MMKIFLIAVLIALAQSQGCVDFLGKSVSWWAVMKYPKTTAASSGIYYSYIDSKTISSG